MALDIWDVIKIVASVIGVALIIIYRKKIARELEKFVNNGSGNKDDGTDEQLRARANELMGRILE